MKIITGTKYPSATAFSGDDEVQEYIEQALADEEYIYEMHSTSGADIINYFTEFVRDTSTETMYIWIHPLRDTFIWSYYTPQEIVKKMDDLVEEAEAQIEKWKAERKK